MKTSIVERAGPALLHRVSGLNKEHCPKCAEETLHRAGAGCVHCGHGAPEIKKPRKPTPKCASKAEERFYLRRKSMLDAIARVQHSADPC